MTETAPTWNGLKRTPLQRKTPLQAKAGLQRKTGLGGTDWYDADRREVREDSEPTWNGLKRTPLKAHTGLARKAPMKATPSKRHYGHLEKHGWCACCGKGTLDTEWHHIKYRSQGGDESDENMLEVCRDCHAAIHAGKITSDEVYYARLTAGSYLQEEARVIGGH